MHVMIHADNILLDLPKLKNACMWIFAPSFQLWFSFENTAGKLLRVVAASDMAKTGFNFSVLLPVAFRWLRSLIMFIY